LIDETVTVPAVVTDDVDLNSDMFKSREPVTIKSPVIV
jgi:hypothetical protein